MRILLSLLCLALSLHSTANADWTRTPTQIDSSASSANAHYNSGGRRIVRIDNTTIALGVVGSADHIFRSINNGSDWTKIDDEYGYSGCLVSGPDNYVYHFSRSGTAIRVVKFLYDETTIPAPVNLYNSLSGSNHGAYTQTNATVNEDGDLFVFYHDDDDTDGTDTLYMLRSVDDGVNWTSPITVRVDAVGDSWGYVHSDVMSNGDIVLAYSEWGSETSQFAISADNGDNWTHTAIASGGIYNPSILPVGTDLYIFAQSEDDDGLVFNKSTDSGDNWDGWVSIQANHGSGYADPSPAVDNNGNIYVAFRGADSYTVLSDDLREYVAMSDDDGDTWTFPFYRSPSDGRVGTRSIMRYQTHYNYSGPVEWTWLEDDSGDYPTLYNINTDITLGPPVTVLDSMNTGGGSYEGS